MWKHELIDSLKLIKPRALYPLKPIVNDMLDMASNSTEFYLGDISSQTGQINKAYYNRGNCDLFSISDNSSLPYSVTLLTFYKENMAKYPNTKIALILKDTDSGVSINIASYHYKENLWCPLPVFAEINGGCVDIKSYSDGYDFSNKDSRHFVDTLYSSVFVALHYLHLMHAKNVFHQPCEPSSAMNRKLSRRGNTIAEKYYTLVFSIPGATVNKNKDTGVYRGVSPLHFCRGHFRDVSENRPLFGRPGCFGRFWIPAHARGKAENGVVMKDYEIKKSNV